MLTAISMISTWWGLSSSVSTCECYIQFWFSDWLSNLHSRFACYWYTLRSLLFCISGKPSNTPQWVCIYIPPSICGVFEKVWLLKTPANSYWLESRIAEKRESWSFDCYLHGCFFLCWLNNDDCRRYGYGWRNKTGEKENVQYSWDQRNDSERTSSLCAIRIHLNLIKKFLSYPINDVE